MGKCGKECVELDVFGASWRRKKARRLKNSYARSCENACDYSELGESMLCTRDLLSSNWRHTHMDIMSTLPSSLEAMKGCVCNKNEVMTENERTKIPDMRKRRRFQGQRGNWSRKIEMMEKWCSEARKWTGKIDLQMKSRTKIKQTQHIRAISSAKITQIIWARKKRAPEESRRLVSRKF